MNQNTQSIPVVVSRVQANPATKEIFDGARELLDGLLHPPVSSASVLYSSVEEHFRSPDSNMARRCLEEALATPHLVDAIELLGRARCCLDMLPDDIDGGQLQTAKDAIAEAYEDLWAWREDLGREVDAMYMSDLSSTHIQASIVDHGDLVLTDDYIGSVDADLLTKLYPRFTDSPLSDYDVHAANVGGAHRIVLRPDIDLHAPPIQGKPDFVLAEATLEQGALLLDMHLPTPSLAQVSVHHETGESGVIRHMPEPHHLKQHYMLVEALQARYRDLVQRGREEPKQSKPSMER